MSSEAFIVGIHSTPTGRFSHCSPSDLARAAYVSALADAQLDGDAIGHVWFSNVFLELWGQRYVKGQVCLAPLVRDGLLPMDVPVTNVEAACASGSMAVNGAMKDVLSGNSNVALAIGVEKMYDPEHPRAIFELLGRSIDHLDPAQGIGYYQRLASQYGLRFEPAADHSIGMDVYALLAGTHMARYGTTKHQLAYAAAKNHTNAVENPRAQYRFPMDADAVLSDRSVREPLTRAMCSPIGDGAAAALVCSGGFLAGLPASVRRRAIRIRAQVIAGPDREAVWGDTRAPVTAARKAYAIAGVAPSDISIAELHDATSFAEIHLVEDLGFCPRGEGGPFTASGATARDGRIPINVSGGLISKGHPVGATGIMMLHELCVQLRGEAGALQVPNVKRALAENGGGLAGSDYAACAVTILDRAE